MLRRATALTAGHCSQRRFHNRSGRARRLRGAYGQRQIDAGVVAAGAHAHRAGRILIDGHDIAEVSRRALRRRLTIIPQEPVLFGGDVRFNLDPGQTASEERLAQALETCSVMRSLASAPGSGTSTPVTRGLELTTAVAPRGSNFSMGQRQAISLGRATVRQSKVVILDEATASVDHESDAAIQQVLSSAFRDGSMLAIVHRLSTIVDFDRVIVMGAGAVKEMGPPLELFAQKGAFTDMVTQSIKHGKGGEWTLQKLQILGLEDAFGEVSEG